jgi:aspartate/methionine/tyrosine aminotransferase
MRNRQKLAGRNLDIIKQNLDVIDALFGRYPSMFRWIRPRAGSMAFPRYLGGNVEDFCDDLVRKAGVLLLPGSVYDDADNHFRLGLGRKNLPQAVEVLEKYLSR